MNFKRKYIEKLSEKQTFQFPDGNKETRRPEDLEIAVDLVLSRAGPPEQFEAAQGGHSERHRTAHMRGLIPAGGNELYPRRTRRLGELGTFQQGLGRLPAVPERRRKRDHQLFLLVIAT